MPIDLTEFTLSPNLIFFLVLAGVAVLSALGVVLFANAVRSALCLVLNFLVLAVVYFTLGAEMLGIVQIVVYTGAIMVLFLFVLMLLNLGAPQALNEAKDLRKFLGVPLGLALIGLVTVQVLVPLGAYSNIPTPDNFGAPEAIGRTLFTNYILPFEAVGILLLVGIVGSILLAKRRV